MSSNAIGAIQTADLAGLSTNDIAALRSNQLAGLTTDQVGALSTNQIVALTTAAVSPDHQPDRRLTTGQASVLSTAQVPR
nr:hypothetical protein [Duganella sp. BJB1802]